MTDKWTVTVAFSSKSKRQVERVREDFMAVALAMTDEGDPINGGLYESTYFYPAFKGADFAGADDFAIFGDALTGKVKKDGSEYVWETQYYDAETPFPTVYGAIAKKYYPGVEASYVSENDNGAEGFRDDPKGLLTGGHRYKVTVQLDPQHIYGVYADSARDFCDVLSKIPNAPTVAWFAGESMDNAVRRCDAAIDKQLYHDGASYIEWKDVKLNDAVLVDGTPLKDINFARIPKRDIEGMLYGRDR